MDRANKCRISDGYFVKTTGRTFFSPVVFGIEPPNDMGSNQITRLTFTCTKAALETLGRKVRNMFKVNNKNTRTTSLTSFWCFYC